MSCFYCRSEKFKNKLRKFKLNYYCLSILSLIISLSFVGCGKVSVSVTDVSQPSANPTATPVGNVDQTYGQSLTQVSEHKTSGGYTIRTFQGSFGASEKHTLKNNGTVYSQVQGSSNVQAGGSQ